MTDDHLIFGRHEPGETGDVDVDELRAALASTPDTPAAATVPAPPPRRRDPEIERFGSRRRHRVWLIIAVVVLVVIVAGSGRRIRHLAVHRRPGRRLPGHRRHRGDRPGAGR